MRCNPSAAILAALLLSTSPAVAQDSSPTRRHTVDSSLNDREFLHPDVDPIDLRGVDQGPDGFRAGTPALQNADTTVALVDRDELRARRLALYSGAPGFDRPVARRVAERDDEPLDAPLSIDEPREEDGPGTGGVAFVALLAAVCGGGAVWLLRRR